MHMESKAAIIHLVHPSKALAHQLSDKAGCSLQATTIILSETQVDARTTVRSVGSYSML